MGRSQLAITTLLLVSCAGGPEVEVDLLNWTQTFIESTEHWSPVELHYKIKNIGEEDIDSYIIYGRVVCECGSEFSDSAQGSDLSIGEQQEGYFSINSLGKRAVNVKITDWETN